MEVKEIQNKNIWEEFILGCKEKTFLQSWYWGDFNGLMGNKFWRLGFYKDNKLAGVVLVLKIKAKRGTFLLIQHGPCFQDPDLKVEILGVLSKKLREIGRQEKASFARMASLLEKNKENEKFFQKLRFKKSPMHANAYEATWKLDTTFSEEEILMNMRKTTRYLVRKAKKDPDIEIQKSNNSKDLEVYNELNKKVAGYQKFVPFSYDFIKKEFEVFSKENKILLFSGKYKKKTVSAGLVIFWSEIGFYHQAALDPEYRKTPVAYLLQWEAVKEAKRRGCKLYDFWGYVDPKTQPKHPWAGPTLFKMGFGGKAYQYLETQDLPFSKKYQLIYFFEKIRSKKRGL